MLHRSHTAPDAPAGTARDETISKLAESLRARVQGLKDPQIEARVREYFERHPNHSCDLIHVAAVACGFQAAEERAATLNSSIETAEAISQRI